jgi:hypothetical protein
MICLFFIGTKIIKFFFFAGFTVYRWNRHRGNIHLYSTLNCMSFVHCLGPSKVFGFHVEAWIGLPLQLVAGEPHSLPKCSSIHALMVYFRIWRNPPTSSLLMAISLAFPAIRSFVCICSSGKYGLILMSWVQSSKHPISPSFHLYLCNYPHTSVLPPSILLTMQCSANWL